MKPNIILLSLILWTGNALAKDNHQHKEHHQSHSQNKMHDKSHHGHDPGHGHGNNKVELQLNKGQRWATDKPLRENMIQIDTQLKYTSGLIGKGTITKKQYQTMGKSMGENIQLIFSNCRLPKEADAQLHIIMAQLLTAQKTMTNKSSLKQKRRAVESAVHAYGNYLKYFDDGSNSGPKKDS